MKIKIKQWLTNIDDPKADDAKHFISKEFGQSVYDEWQLHLAWLRDKTIGDPKSSRAKSVSVMKKEGLVGVYKEMGLREWLAYRWMLIKHWYKRKFVYKVNYVTNQNR